MTTVRDHLSKTDTVTLAAIEARVPTIVEARTLIERFQAIVRQKLVAELDPWIATASAGLIASFAVLQSRSLGRMDRPKGRSRNLSW